MSLLSNAPDTGKKKQRNPFEHTLHLLLQIMEKGIATITLVLLVGALVAEILKVLHNPEYFADASHMLQNLLSIVVGLEFVRMLIDTTPANILEVLTVAITRHVILSHENPLSNMACIACIAGLFAIRRFLIPQGKLGEELVDDGEE